MRKLVYPTLIAIFFASCKEEITPPGNIIKAPDISTAESHTRMETEFEGIDNIVNASLEANGLGNGVSNGRLSAGDPCFQSTLDAVNKTLTIIFDPKVTCLDQNTRSGKIIVNYTDKYVNTGAVIIATLADFSVNGNKLEGTRKLTNLGKTADNYPQFKVEVSNAKLTLTTGEVSTWQSTRTRTQTKGYETPLNPADDEYQIYGTSSGVSGTGVSYTSESKSDSPVVLNIDCLKNKHLPVAGKIKFTPQGESDRIVDYGNGDCDNSLTVSYKGLSFPVTVQ